MFTLFITTQKVERTSLFNYGNRREEKTNENRGLVSTGGGKKFSFI